ncbi:hypothetical protein B0H19DRAFT_654528 [Mycena capillaripes]|nr:hypothetical protein B0H19DRAFT_654528 [Mycena capillaripes]
MWPGDPSASNIDACVRDSGSSLVSLDVEPFRDSERKSPLPATCCSSRPLLASHSLSLRPSLIRTARSRRRRHTTHPALHPRHAISPACSRTHPGQPQLRHHRCTPVAFLASRDRYILRRTIADPMWPGVPRHGGIRAMHAWVGFLARAQVRDHLHAALYLGRVVFIRTHAIQQEPMSFSPLIRISFCYRDNYVPTSHPAHDTGHGAITVTLSTILSCSRTNVSPIPVSTCRKCCAARRYLDARDYRGDDPATPAAVCLSRWAVTYLDASLHR